MSTSPTSNQAVQAGLAFKPEEHLAFSNVPATMSMKDIGYAEDLGVSPVAVTQPFPLFSPSAVQIMRSEIFKPEVLENYSFKSTLAASQLRGYAREHAPFTYAAWNHPDTIAIVSKLAGIDLVPWGDYEIAHINLSVKPEEQARAELDALRYKRAESDEGIDMRASQDTSSDDKPIVAYHRDSYPFVCVLMMSDCTDMVGGETELLTADGEPIRVRGPTQGNAVILQGRYITHQALRALGATERITAVTSWRPRSAFVKDDSTLGTVRPVSNLSELYYDFAEYRLDMMEQRIRREREQMRNRRQTGRKFATTAHKGFLSESTAFMQHTWLEIVPEDQVQAGAIEKIDPCVKHGASG